MRPSPIFVAALLSLAALVSPAFAFDIDSSTSTNPDGTARYADPDDKPIGGPLGAATAPRSGFAGGVTTSTSPSSTPQSWQELDWANPMPPRAGSLR